MSFNLGAVLKKRIEEVSKEYKFEPQSQEEKEQQARALKQFCEQLAVIHYKALVGAGYSDEEATAKVEAMGFVRTDK